MIALTGGRILPVAGEPIEKGTVLVENGKIKAVGADLEVPAGAQVVDVTGMWVTPGLIDVHTHISVMGEPAPTDTVDGNEGSSPITPHLRVIDALNPRDVGITESVKAGFTTCYTGPGSANIIGGTGTAIKLRHGRTIDDIVIPGTVQMKMALGENPKKFYGDMKKQPPMTRMMTAAMLRETLTAAVEYSEALREAEKKGEKPPKKDMKLAALVPVVRGEMRVRIHCHRCDDIYTAIRISEEFGLDFTLEHCTEGYMIADILAQKKIPCVVGPLTMGLRKREIWNADLNNAKTLLEAGVEFSFTEDSSSGTRWLPMHIGLCIGRGLPEDAALRAVTINPARILGLDNRLGTLEPGKDADLAVFNGNPFLNTTLCKATMIDGVFEHNEL